MVSAIVVLIARCVFAEEVPTSGPERLAWMRRHLVNTVSKFEFTQGYSFRKNPENLRLFLEAIKAEGFNTFDQMAHPGGIWKDEHFASLERTLQVAAEVGLKVWASVTPPSAHQEIRRWPLEQRQEYYYDVAERFAQLAKEYPNFVAFMIDEVLDYNASFFRPEMLAEMARRQRAICPRLAFLPLGYYGSMSEEMFEKRGQYIDGVIFHFRAGSYPPAYIPGYDPKSFDMYGDVMRYELKRVRQIAGDHPVICGIYLYYHEGGWGVMTPDGKKPATEHTVRDATQKLEIAHEYADGIRIYGLGIKHEAYQAMGELLHKWQAAGRDWGQKRGDPESHLARWQKELGEGPFLGTLLNRDRGLAAALPNTCPWLRLELVRTFQGGNFDPAEAARRYPLLVVSKSRMSREWPGLLRDYAQAGGTLVLESVPGWWLDTEASPLVEGESEAGDQGVLTLAFGELSGVEFHYERRGFATRWRVVKDHPLTKGLGKPGVWHEVPYKEGGNTYGYLVHPAKATDGEVLIEVEHESCPYDGVSYLRQGKINGVYPLLTTKQVGRGFVVRHYAAVSPGTVFADGYQKLMENLLRLAEKNPKRDSTLR